MTGLHRAATLLVARHGEAEYEQPGVMTDEGGWLTALGRGQATALARSLTARHIAAVYSSTLRRAVESAQVAAGVLGLTATAVDGLHEFPVGDLAGRPEDDPDVGASYRAWLAAGPEAPIPGGAETGSAVLARYGGALRAIADQHRGETVLVFSHGGVIGYALPRLAHNVADDLDSHGYLPNCAFAEVAVGADGVEVVTWPELVDWPAPVAAPAVQPPPG